MNNPLSYCGLVDVKIRASDKNLPVRKCLNLSKLACHYHNLLKKDTKTFLIERSSRVDVPLACGESDCEDGSGNSLVNTPSKNSENKQKNLPKC